MENSNIVKKDKFRIAYIGNFLANQNIDALWSVISKLVTNHKDLAKDLEIMIVGNAHNEVFEALKASGLSKYLKRINYVPHYQAIELMQEASVLLFIIPNILDNKGIITGKLFDYLASSRPLLSIGPSDGDAAKILKKVNAGEIIDSTDAAGIQKRIEDLYRLWCTSNLHTAIPNKSMIKEFERRELTRKLADTIIGRSKIV